MADVKRILTPEMQAKVDELQKKIAEKEALLKEWIDHMSVVEKKIEELKGQHLADVTQTIPIWTDNLDKSLKEKNTVESDLAKLRKDYNNLDNTPPNAKDINLGRVKDIDPIKLEIPKIEDPDGDNVTTELKDQKTPGGGEVKNGVYTHPKVKSDTPDKVIYTADDGKGGIVEKTIEFTLYHANEAPKISDRENIRVGDKDGVKVVLPTFTDPDGDKVTPELKNQKTPGGGEVKDGIYYPPKVKADTPDTIIFTATDEHGASSTSALKYTVFHENRAPESTNKDMGRFGDSKPVKIEIPDILDEEDGKIKPKLQEGKTPAGGEVKDGMYIPPLVKIDTPDTITIIATDKDGASSTSTLKYTVFHENRAPNPINENIGKLPDDKPVNMNIKVPKGNDPDGDDVKSWPKDGDTPAGGKVKDGVYTPPKVKTDTPDIVIVFSDDGKGKITRGKLEFTVFHEKSLPKVDGGTYTVFKGKSLKVDLTNNHVKNADSDTRIEVAGSIPQNGTFKNGTYEYNPGNYIGKTTLGFKATNLDGFSAEAIQVNVIEPWNNLKTGLSGLNTLLGHASRFAGSFLGFNALGMKAKEQWDNYAKAANAGKIEKLTGDVQQLEGRIAADKESEKAKLTDIKAKEAEVAKAEKDYKTAEKAMKNATLKVEKWSGKYVGGLKDVTDNNSLSNSNKELLKKAIRGVFEDQLSHIQDYIKSAGGDFGTKLVESLESIKNLDDTGVKKVLDNLDKVASQLKSGIPSAAAPASAAPSIDSKAASAQDRKAQKTERAEAAKIKLEKATTDKDAALKDLSDAQNAVAANERQLEKLKAGITAAEAQLRKVVNLEADKVIKDAQQPFVFAMLPNFANELLKEINVAKGAGIAAGAGVSLVINPMFLMLGSSILDMGAKATAGKGIVSDAFEGMALGGGLVLLAASSAAYKALSIGVVAIKTSIQYGAEYSASIGKIEEKGVVIAKTISDGLDTAWLVGSLTQVAPEVVKAAQSTLSKAPVFFAAEVIASAGYCYYYEKYHSAEFYDNAAKQAELHTPKLSVEHSEL